MPSSHVLLHNKVYKNISIKMLKDVGKIVLKSRETSAVYMQQHRGLGHATIIIYKCEKHFIRM